MKSRPTSHVDAENWVSLQTQRLCGTLLSAKYCETKPLQSI